MKQNMQQGIGILGYKNPSSASATAGGLAMLNNLNNSSLPSGGISNLSNISGLSVPNTGDEAIVEATIDQEMLIEFER
jgi:hypothetical protein